MAKALAPLEKRYSKALCHLNYARRHNRLGLILGSGVSASLDIPKWTDLINDLEKRLSYDSGQAPEAYRAEQLFQFYKTKESAKLGWKTDNRLASAISSGWRDTVASCLYKKFYSANGKSNLKAYEKAIEAHPYLKDLGNLALTAQLVVTHNFDDALETAIDLNPSVPAPPGRRYHTFWKPEPFLRPGMVNIYHPNGFTPLRPFPKGSENLILTEASFADHLANTNTAESNFLLRHLADKTCLIVGHSLADGTLKNALRQHANQRPGHVNYYMHWNKQGEAGLDDDQRSAIREANFETYNLITIFASSAEISQVLKLVAMDEPGLEGALAHHSTPSRYVYYVVGAVSSGKSTTLRNLRDLATVEEWPGDMPKAMNRPSLGLAPTTQAVIDAKLEDAIWVKNGEIRDIKVGIVAVDRAPLDFIAFPTGKRETLGATARKRAKSVLKRLEASNFSDLCSGQVVVVRAEANVLVERQLQRGRRVKMSEVASGSAARYLERQKNLIAQIYQSTIWAGNAIDADGCTLATSVKHAARIIHFGEYRPFDFVGRLQSLKRSK